MSGGVWKKFQMSNFDIPNNVSSMKYALKSVPGLADVWVPHGVEDGPRTLAPGSGSKMYAYHDDQHGGCAFLIWTLWPEIWSNPRLHGGPQHQQGQGLTLEHTS